MTKDEIITGLAEKFLSKGVALDNERVLLRKEENARELVEEDVRTLEGYLRKIAQSAGHTGALCNLPEIIEEKLK